ncbi:MAG: response regulator [Pseudomonadota bacterium]
MSEKPALSVLVVEDESEIRRALSTYAEKRGFVCTAVGDGRQALELGLQHHYDVILLDISLPSLDGHQVLKGLTEKRAVDETVVLFLTAHDTQLDRRVGLELGADDYETKPVHLATLFSKIEWLLEKRRLRSGGGA